MDHVTRLHDNYNDLWVDVDVVYGSLQHKDHWLLLTLDMRVGTLYMLDSIPSHINPSALKVLLEPLSYTIPSVLRFCHVTDVKLEQDKVHGLSSV